MFNILKSAADGILSKVNNGEAISNIPENITEEQVFCKNNVVVESTGGKDTAGYFTLKHIIYTVPERDVLVLCWIPNSLFTMSMRDTSGIVNGDRPKQMQLDGREIGLPIDGTHLSEPQANVAMDKIEGGLFSTPHGEVFSINLDDMRALTLFYSREELSRGYLVVSNLENQYKVFHFPHDGIEKLANIFEGWQGCKEHSKSPQETMQRVFVISKNVSAPVRTESGLDLHPQEGNYYPVNQAIWKGFLNPKGQIEDLNSFKKVCAISSIFCLLVIKCCPF